MKIKFWGILRKTGKDRYICAKKIWMLKFLLLIWPWPFIGLHKQKRRVTLFVLCIILDVHHLLCVHTDLLQLLPSPLCINWVTFHRSFNNITRHDFIRLVDSHLCHLGYEVHDPWRSFLWIGWSSVTSCGGPEKFQL